MHTYTHIHSYVQELLTLEVASVERQNAYIHTYTHIHTYIHTYVQELLTLEVASVERQNETLRKEKEDLKVCIDMHAYMHRYIHICVHTDIKAYIHTYMNEKTI